LETINQKLVLATHHLNGDMIDRSVYESTAEGLTNALGAYEGACSRAELGEEVSLFLEDGEDETAVLRRYIS